MDEATSLAALAITATCVASLVWIIKYLFENIKPVLERLVVTTEENTKATRAADEYLRERNGRDITFHTKLVEKLESITVTTAKQAEIVSSQLKRLGDLTAQRVRQADEENKHQTITEQTVETQIINKTK